MSDGSKLSTNLEYRLRKLVESHEKLIVSKALESSGQGTVKLLHREHKVTEHEQLLAEREKRVANREQRVADCECFVAAYRRKAEEQAKDENEFLKDKLSKTECTSTALRRQLILN